MIRRKTNKNADMEFGYTKPDDYSDGMYDELTGIPSFNLYEDRLQVALLNERVKDFRLRKLKIAVVGVYIENFSALTTEEAKETVLQTTSETLLRTLPLNYTVARGINYHFWLMMPYLSTREDAEIMVEKVQNALSFKVKDGGKEVRIKYKLGVCLYEHDPDDTVKTLVGKAIYAVQKAVADNKDVVYFADLKDF